MSKDLSKEQVEAWKQNTVTIQFLKAVQARREEVKEMAIIAAMDYEQAIGMAAAYQAVLDWSYGDE